MAMVDGIRSFLSICSIDWCVRLIRAAAFCFSYGEVSHDRPRHRGWELVGLAAS